MNLSIVTIEELQKFKIELLAEIKLLLNEKQELQSKKWLRRTEIRSILKCSDAKIQSLRINGELKFRKIGGTYYYQLE